MKGKMIIFSAPSGAGKTTIVKHITENVHILGFSVSATSRKPRAGEEQGVDYFFMTPEEFRKSISAGNFVEWEEVYRDHYYGTLKSEIDRIWGEGKHIIFDVDVRGGISLKKIFGKRALSIFIMPPSVAELEKRLRNRGKDSDEKIRMRIEKATEEIRYADKFDSIIINDDLEKARKETLVMVSGFLKLP
jgi:guanylate kinase